MRAVTEALARIHDVQERRPWPVRAAGHRARGERPDRLGRAAGGGRGLVRYAPAERPETRWASEGTLLILAVWLGASLLFRWYVGSAANFKTHPAG
jgi:hypothetical protein